MTNTSHMIEGRIQGIPCLIDVFTCYVTKGTYSRQAETPEEYYGACDIEFGVCDRKGRPAPWLERKMTDDDKNEIENLIIAQKDNDDPY